jgi:YHS domain-containing protein
MRLRRALAHARNGRALVLCVLVLGACASPPRGRVPAVNAEASVALHGYDPVAYFTRGEPARGSEHYTATWRGVVYRFASPENLALFEAEPERYLPQYGGYCAIAMAWNTIADVDPEQWAIVDGRLYLNNSAFAHALWSLDRRGHIEDADRNWRSFPVRGRAP